MTDEIDFYLEQRAEQQREAQAQATQTEDPGGPPADQVQAEPTPAENKDLGGSDSSDGWDSSGSSSDDYPASNGDGSGGGGANPFGAMVSRIADWFAGAAASRDDDLVEPNLTDFSDLGVRATPLGREKEAEQRQQYNAELQRIAAFNKAENDRDSNWRKDDDAPEEKVAAKPHDEASDTPGQPEKTWVDGDLVGGAKPAATPSEESDKTWIEDALQPETMSRAKSTYLDTFREAVTEVVASATEAVRQEVQKVRVSIEAAKDQYTNLDMTVQQAEQFLSGKVEEVVQQRFAALDNPHAQIDDFMPLMLGINKGSVAPKEAAKTVKDVLTGALTAKQLVLDQFSPYKFLDEVTKDEGSTEALVVLFKSYDENKRVEAIADWVVTALKKVEDMVDLRSQVD